MRSCQHKPNDTPQILKVHIFVALLIECGDTSTNLPEVPDAFNVYFISSQQLNNTVKLINMYKVSQKLTNFVKLIVHNGVQQVTEFEVVLVDSIFLLLRHCRYTCREVIKFLAWLRGLLIIQQGDVCATFYF